MSIWLVVPLVGFIYLLIGLALVAVLSRIVELENDDWWPAITLLWPLIIATAAFAVPTIVGMRLVERGLQWAIRQVLPK